MNSIDEVVEIVRCSKVDILFRHGVLNALAICRYITIVILESNDSLVFTPEAHFAYAVSLLDDVGVNTVNLFHKLRV